MWLLFAAVAQTPLDSLDAVVFVQQGSSACAGTLINPDGLVLTAYHCVVAGGRPKVTTREGTVGIGRVRRVDRRHDLALIDVPSLAGKPWTGLGDLPDVGDTVRAMGHPYGSDFPVGFFEQTLRWSVSQGIVAAVGTIALQTTAPVNPGNSGGPLIDDEGKVVAVVSRKLRGDGLGFAGRMDERAAWLKLPRRRMGPGGSLGVETVVQANGVSAIPLSFGLRVHLVLRDRVVLAATGAFPLGIRWQALQLGQAEHEPAEVRIALRQRFFRGSWAVRVDGYAAWAIIERYTQGPGVIDLSSRVRGRPLFGARVAFRNIAFEWGQTIERPSFARMQIVVRWPGTLFVL